MATFNYQYELIKLYLAAFVRAPEKSGLDYWLAQINGGRSFDAILETVFSLDIVKAIYPTAMTNQVFVTAIYANVFGKVPDAEGLAYWVGQLNGGLGRGKLVMDMINAGLSTPDGTPGKAYIVNRLAVSQYAVDLQNAQQTEFTPSFLKNVLQTVNADTSTVGSAQKALDPSVTGIGIGAPSNALTVPAAANGLSAAEIKAGVKVTIDLKGTNAIVGHIVEILIDNAPFPESVTYVLTAADIKAQFATLTTPTTSVWGSDGTHSLSAYIRNTAGVKGNVGGEIAVVVNQIAPFAPRIPVDIAAATDGINAVEKAAGVAVKVNLTGTGALAGDTVEVLLDGKSFSPTALKTVTAADLDAGFVMATIPSNAAWGSDGEKIIAARVIDLAGNVGSIGGGLAVQLDQTAPAAFKNLLAIDAAVGGLSVAERSIDVMVKVNLTAMSLATGDQIELLIDGKPFANSTLHQFSPEEIAAKLALVRISGGDTAWGSTDGIRVITARVIDAAGNIGVAGGDLKVMVDSQAPASQNTTISVAAAVNGVSATELAAGVDVVVNLNGSNALAGDVVVLLLDGQPIGSGLNATLTAAQVSAKILSIKVPNGAYWGADGTKVFTAYIRDSAGNVGANSSDFSFALDTKAPTKPSVLPLVPAAASNINASEKSAGVQVKVDLASTDALVGDKVEILLNGASMTTPVYQTIQVADLLNGFVIASIPSGAGWGADGNKTLAARVIDVAGNVGAISDNVAVVLDTIVASGPTAILQVAANSGGGLTPIERSAGVVVVADLTGTTALAGEQIEILIGGQSFATPVIKTLTAAEVAAKSVSLTIGTNDGWGASGSKDLTARFIDVSGNQGTASGKVSVTVLAPNPISNPLQIPVAVGGINPLEKASTIVVSANLAGTNVQAGDAIELLIDNKPFTNSTLHVISASEIAAGIANLTIAGGDPAWGAVDGDRTIAARIIDTAGKVGVSGGALKVSLDSVGPLSEKITLTVPAALNGLNAAELAAGVSVNVSLTGTNAVAGDIVTLLLGSTNPVPIVSVNLSAAQVTAKSAVIIIPGTVNWGGDGNKTLSAYITDTAGNQGLTGGALNVVVDSIVPNMPSNPVQVPAATNAINSAEKQAGVSVIIDLTGTNAGAGDKVEVLLGGVPFSTPILQNLSATDLSNRSVTVVIPNTAVWGSDGIKLLSARVIDTTGNIGPASVATAAEIDFTAPAAFKGSIQIDAAIGGLSAVEKANDVMVTVNLTGQNVVLGDSIELLIDGRPFAVSTLHEVTVDEVASKLAQLKITAADSGWGLTDGLKVITARVIDAAGNVGVAGGDLKVTVDSQAPTSQNATITIAAAANGVSASELAAGVDVTINLNGSNAVAGDVVTLLLDGQAIGTGISATLSAAQVSAKTLTLKIPNGAYWGSDGSKTISAFIRDSAGNVGASSNNFTVNLDTQAPSKPSVLPVIAAATSNINASEKTAGVVMKVDLTSTGGLAGDKVEIVLNGASMTTPVLQTIQVADLINGYVNVTIPSAAGWGADGSKVFAARVIDVAGNVGPISDSVSVVLDTIAPAGPTAILQVAANSGGGLTPAERAAGVVVVADLTGTTAVAGEQIEILIGGVSFATPVIKTLSAAEVLAKSVSLTIGTTDGWGAGGSKDLTARFIDASGNTGTAAGKVSVIVLSPNPIASPLQIPVAVGGINPTERANAMVVTASLAGTNVQVGDAIELTIDGKSFTNSTLHIISAGEIAAGTANLSITGGDSAWGVTDGDRTIAARIVDTTGKVGVSGGSLKVTLDSIAPASQNVVLTAPAALNGLNASELAAGVDVTVNLTGTNAVAGDVVTLMLGGAGFTPIVSVTLSAAQITAKSAVVTIPGSVNWGGDGNKTLSAYITDTAGNQGLPGGALNVVVDALVPSSPSNPILIPAALNSINSTEKQSGVTVLIDLTGTNAASGDRVEILIGGASFSTPILQSITTTDISNNLVNAVIPSTANWGSDGIKLISARIVDVTGNLGPASAAVSVNLDTVAPSGPGSLLQIPANAGGGIGPAERAAGVVVTVDLTGTTATVGDTIEILIGGTSFATPVSKVLNLTDLVNRSVSMTIGTSDGWGADGSKILSARFIDSSGNFGSAGGAVTVTLDGTPPGATPTPLVVTAASNGLSGVEKNVGVDVQIDLNSTGVIAGDTVSILLDGLPFSVPVTQTISAAQVLAKSATVTIPGSAVWGPDGNKVLTAIFTDVLGNVGAAGGSLTISLDTTAPLSPSNSVAIAAASNGINAAEKAAGVAVVVDLTGTSAVVGDRAEILIGGVSFPTAVMQTIGASDVSNGSISLMIPANAVWGSDGSKIISARILDFAGNPGALGGAISVNLDTTAPNPTPTALSVPAASGGIDNAEKVAGVAVNVDLTGTNIVAGDQVEILIGGASFTIPVLHTVTAGEVAAKLATATILQTSGWGNDNDKVFTARFVDVAGNVSAAGGSLTVSMQDTTPPNAPVSQLYAPAAGGGISLAEKNAGITVTGYIAGTLAVAGDTATLLIDGNGFASAITHVLTGAEISAGNFDFTVPSGAGWGSDGSHVLSMHITDVAGNVGNAGGAVTINLDTVAPTAPSNPVAAAVATNGINAVEKTAGVVATVDLTGTGAVLSDKVEILLGGSSFTIPVIHSITAGELAAGLVNVTIDANAGWGADGVKTISARVIDVAGNVGAIGGSLTTSMETSIPAAAGLPTFNDNDSNGLINNLDTYVFYISEATNKALGLANVQITNSHSFGTGASVSWSSDGTQMTLTLGTGTTVAVGDIISLIGVSDLAGNTNSLSFTI
ncbi:DUF4214 domain-containing protein [Undibacterium cyanobacteriorum]|uniref:DUF4214 domain-containing protein n=1 Tax=Undibacterium cyanobacteriorum TaxID=3073561 RepID=A0ABY9RKH8_9BURK|nr:DUF4214 domain-containing protein [Undibacterium sp. 20NA77.5]WMW81726.1 DUF4214 domain-containing protein [Undibacterium sp. 20NA77.5]